MGKATYLKQLRQARGLQQKEVAKAVGVTVQYYCEVENGKVPSLRLTKKLAAFFNEPIESLFRDHF